MAKTVNQQFLTEELSWFTVSPLPISENRIKCFISRQVYSIRKKQKEFKAENPHWNSKKEDEKVLFPFNERDTQRVWSVIFIIIGLLIMIIKPLSNIIDNIGLNSFITGLIITFAGFFYFMDIQ